MIQKSTLPNGLRLVTEEIASVSCVSLGLWAAAGSRDEATEENGLAHLIEHMVFKGTASCDKLAIAKEMDRQGGLANAFTTKEHTCFHTRVRPEHLPLALELLADIFLHSLYDEKELELEKDVIAQEIAMVEDEPEDFIHDLASLAHWPDHPLGRPVTGTLETLRNLDRQSIMKWIGQNYGAERLVLAASGRLEHQRLELMVARLLGSIARGAPRVLNPPRCGQALMVKRRRLEQGHLLFSADFPSQNDPRRRAAAVFNAALGGNLSSRLFQEIREKRGLAYSVYSDYSAYSDVGLLEIYAGAAPQRLGETKRLIEAELARLRDKSFTESEVAEAVASLKTSLILSGESMDSRMSRLAKNELAYGRQLPLEEIFRELDQVRSEDLRSLAEDFLSPSVSSLCVLGPVTKRDL